MGVDNGLAPSKLASSKISRVHFYWDMKIPNSNEQLQYQETAIIVQVL